MRILTFTGYYLPGYKGGGPIKTIKNLFDSTASNEIQYRLVTSDRDLGDTEPFSNVTRGEWNEVGNADVFYTAADSNGTEQIQSLVANEEYDFIYLNSFFSFRFSIYPQLLARKYKRTVIVGPRGEFSQGALDLKPFKKKLFVQLYKLAGLHKNAIFQASSKYEAEDIRRLLGQNVDIKIAEDIGAQEFATNLPKQDSYKTRIIFISRISPKKNLKQAIQVLEQVKKPVVYDIYGPIEDKGYWEQCKSAINQLPEHINVKYCGSLTPDHVIDTMAGYDMFFMPTFGENYGHVIAEAFCAGLPVLIADTTPWRQLEEKSIGWDIPLASSEKFSQIIDDFAELSEVQYKEKRQKVLTWAKRKFSQRDAIDANIAMFKYAYEKSRK